LVSLGAVNRTDVYLESEKIERSSKGLSAEILNTMYFTDSTGIYFGLGLDFLTVADTEEDYKQIFNAVGLHVEIEDDVVYGFNTCIGFSFRERLIDGFSLYTNLGCRLALEKELINGTISNAMILGSTIYYSKIGANYSISSLNTGPGFNVGAGLQLTKQFSINAGISGYLTIYRSEQVELQTAKIILETNSTHIDFYALNITPYLGFSFM
jgi:hypothetical protein